MIKKKTIYLTHLFDFYVNNQNFPSLLNFNFILYQIKWYYKDTIQFSFSFLTVNLH